MPRSNMPEPVAVSDTRSQRRSSARTGAVAGVVALWWTIGGEVALLGLVALAVLVSPLLAFVVAVAGLTLVDTVCCTWLDLHWDEWMAKTGDRLARTLERMRSSDILRRLVGWMTGPSRIRFAIAAVVTSPVTTVCIVRLGGGAAIGRDRVVGAALANAAVVGALAAICGYLVAFLRGA